MKIEMRVFEINTEHFQFWDQFEPSRLEIFNKNNFWQQN